VAPFNFDGYNAQVRPATALAVALGAVLAASAAAAPKPHAERAQSGDVEAVFSYTYDRAKFRFGRQRLTIVRLGETRFSARLRKPPLGGFNAQPARYFEHRPSVSISDLDGDGEPEVVLTSTGAARTAAGTRRSTATSTAAPATARTSTSGGTSATSSPTSSTTAGRSW
jgi:hypothetical protein